MIRRFRSIADQVVRGVNYVEAFFKGRVRGSQSAYRYYLPSVEFNSGKPMLSRHSV